MAKKIIVEIDENGNCSIDGVGFSGPECSKHIDEVAQDLGVVKDRQKKENLHKETILAIEIKQRDKMKRNIAVATLTHHLDQMYALLESFIDNAPDQVALLRDTNPEDLIDFLNNHLDDDRQKYCELVCNMITIAYAEVFIRKESRGIDDLQDMQPEDTEE